MCVRGGYGRKGSRCVKLAKSCPKDALWSKAEKRCVCKQGFIEKGKKCVDPALAVAAIMPEGAQRCMWPRVPASNGAGCVCGAGYKEQDGQCVRDPSQALAAPEPPKPSNKPLGSYADQVARVQQCLKQTGFLRGRVERRMTPKAWTAFWYFKRAHKIGSTPDGIKNKKAQKVLFALCGPGETKVAALNEGKGTTPLTRSATDAEGSTPPARTTVKRVYAKPEAGCLPKELHALVVATYGARPGLKQCSQTCIAKPKTLSKRILAEYEKKRGIAWCQSCIELHSSLPLDDILRIERGANVQICTRPPSQLPRWVRPARQSRQAYTKVREIYRALPPAEDRSGDIAVIIGNRRYRGDIPANETAQNNAGAMYALLTEHLGYRFENIIDLRDATMKDLARVFGTAESHEGDLWRKSRKRPEASVLIYFAGHARASADQKDSYLLPVDAVKHRESRTAYPVSQLYANLRKLGAKSMLLLLEAGFGRDHGDFVFPPNIPEMWVRSLPVDPVPGLTVMTAADRDQKTLDDPLYGVGLFTRYLIEGLAGRADLAPIGNADRKIEAVELYAYTAHMVGLAARKSFGLLQRPLLSRQGNTVVSRVEAQVR
ncbi:MAG: caspase family protein [Methyloligellaceae bacterium]